MTELTTSAAKRLYGKLPTSTETTGTTESNWKEVGRALIAAIITPVVPIIQATLEAGSLVFPVHQIEVAAISGAVGYLAVRFLKTGTQQITTFKRPK